VYPRRLHADNTGATTKPITKHWLHDLAQPWDIDVTYKEFLPCKPPVRTAAADAGPVALPQRMNSKAERAAFIAGEDLSVTGMKALNASAARQTGPRFIAAKQSTRAALEERRECLEIFARGALKVAERKVDVQARLRQRFRQMRRMMSKPASSPAVSPKKREATIEGGSS